MGEVERYIERDMQRETEKHSREINIYRDRDKQRDGKKRLVQYMETGGEIERERAKREREIAVDYAYAARIRAENMN